MASKDGGNGNGDGGSSKAPPHGKGPASEEDPAPFALEKEDNDEEVAATDDKGKAEMVVGAGAIKITDKSMNQIRTVVAGLAPPTTTQPGMEDGGKGKRDAEPSGGTEAKRLRTACGSLSRRAQTLGPDMTAGGMGIEGSGLPDATLSLFFEDPEFISNAASSAMEKGYRMPVPRTAPQPGAAPPTQPGALPCLICRVNEATTAMHTAPSSHRCVCEPCLPHVADAPLQARCVVCCLESQEYVKETPEEVRDEEI